MTTRDLLEKVIRDMGADGLMKQVKASELYCGCYIGNLMPHGCEGCGNCVPASRCIDGELIPMEVEDAERKHA